jgi:hypothetical protein
MTTRDTQLKQLIGEVAEEANTLAEKIHELCKGKNRLTTKWALIDIIAHEYDSEEIGEFIDDAAQYRLGCNQSKGPYVEARSLGLTGQRPGVPAPNAAVASTDDPPTP